MSYELTRLGYLHCLLTFNYNYILKFLCGALAGMGRGANGTVALVVISRVQDQAFSFP